MRATRTVTALLGAAILLAAGTSVTVTGAGAQGVNPWLERRVLVIAHAGGEDEAPHETMFAYKRAHGLGAEVLEGDVRLTGDGVLVVHHDDDVDATTDGTGLVIDKTYAELFALDHGYKFTPYDWSCDDCPEEDYVYRGVRTGTKPPPTGYAAEDFTIPTAEQLFQTFPDTWLDLEIKEEGAAARAAADALIALVREYGAADRTVIVSFDQATVDYVRQQMPEAITSPGIDGITDWFLAGQPLTGHSILQVPPRFGDIEVVTPDFVARAHADGLAVWVWMDSKEQESAEFYAELLAMGVDGLLVSRPSVAREVVDAAGLTYAPAGTPPDGTVTPTTATSVVASAQTTGTPATSAPATAAATAPRYAG
jgi:glycerophosphoryl diester phosphodiesterase